MGILARERKREIWEKRNRKKYLCAYGNIISSFVEEEYGGGHTIRETVTETENSIRKKWWDYLNMSMTIGHSDTE